MHDTLTLSALALDCLTGAPIATATHCYGCSAGQGGNCGGALERWR
ncbi:MAG: DUF3641 domain-containing protein [Methylovulum sp.]|nr:DUF3641 domain-containing protein [Methylovulum sp.]